MMNAEKWFKDKLEAFSGDAEFYAEELILDLTEQIVSIMKELNVNRTELARRLGVSKAFITKFLNGNTNITLKTMASLARSLGCNVNINICSKDVQLIGLYEVPSSSKRKNIDPGQYTKVVNTVKQEPGDERFAAFA